MPGIGKILRKLYIRYLENILTGAGHRWTGIGAAFIAAAIARLCHFPEAIAAAFAAVTTTMPDWLEIPIYFNGVRKGSLIQHRTLTHWPALWLGLIVYAAFALQPLAGAIVIGMGVGSLTHILGDAPNPMGIPWIYPHRRLRIGKKGLWRSGEHEFFMIMTYALGGYCFWKLTGGHLSGLPY